MEHAAQRRTLPRRVPRRHQSAVEHSQATLFVDIFTQTGERSAIWRGTASTPELQTLLGRFLGPARAADAFAQLARERGLQSADELTGDAEVVRYAERELAGAVGAASARVLVASVVQEEPLGIDEVMHILDETSQVIAYSHQLEQKSRELEAASAELRAANARLQELDRLKDDFISMVSHELRTPLTSIRAFTEILHDNPALETAERTRFLSIVIKETERLTRLINQVLDLAKIESGNAEWHEAELSIREVIEDSIAATSQLFEERGVRLAIALAPDVPPILADRDRLVQVMLNLLSNAVKFCSADGGEVAIALRREGSVVRVDVRDNGMGIGRETQAMIFEKFRQGGDTMTGKPQGTGLGLPICRQIINHFGGRLWVESEIGKGSTFSFVLPMRAATTSQRAAA